MSDGRTGNGDSDHPSDIVNPLGGGSDEGNQGRDPSIEGKGQRDGKKADGTPPRVQTIYRKIWFKNGYENGQFLKNQSRIDQF